MNRARGEAGFTLVEVLAAAAVLVVGIVIVLGNFLDTQHATTTTLRQDEAATLASQAIERVRELPYSQMAVSGAYPASSGSDPLSGLSTVAGTSYFTDPAGQLEPLVPSQSSSRIQPVSVPSITVGAGGSGVTATVYTFITYAAETCPAGSTSSTSQLSALQSSLTTANTDLTTLLGSGSGSITATIALGNGLLNGALKLLLGPITTPLTTLTGTTLPALQTRLTALQTRLNSLGLVSKLNTLVASGLSTIDLCNITSSLDQLATLTTDLSLVQTATTTVAAAGTSISGVTSLNVSSTSASVAASLTADNTTLSSVTTTENAALTAPDVPTSVYNGLASLNSTAPSSTQLPKRITVAVSLSTPGTGIGLKSPVWMSTIAADPNTGLP